MKAWKYHRGEWSEIDAPPVWNEGNTWEQNLEQAGYNRFAAVAFGTEWGPNAEVFTKKSKEPPYLVVFSFGDDAQDVYCDDMPSLMQWLRDYAPLFSLQTIEFLLEEQENLLEKAFRAWHGHAPSRVCERCDPEQYKRLLENARRRAEKGKQS